MLYQLSICLLPAVVASASFRTITTDTPVQSPVIANGPLQGAYLARRQDSTNGGCGVAQVDCQNGWCCETAHTCAMRNGQTVCLPAGISFADPVSAFRPSEGVSAVVPTSSGVAEQTMSSAPVAPPAAASESQSDDSPAAAETGSAPAQSPATGDDTGNAAGSRPNGNSSGGSSLSGGAIAGIVVGVVVGVLIVVGAIGFMVFRARKRDRVDYSEPAASGGAAAAPAPAKTVKPTGPAELETVERVEMEGTVPEEKNLDFGPRSPQEVEGSVPSGEKTG